MPATMKKECKLSFTLSDADDCGNKISSSHETGEDNIYVWKDNSIALALTETQARELSDALVQLADKMLEEGK